MKLEKESQNAFHGYQFNNLYKFEVPESRVKIWSKEDSQVRRFLSWTSQKGWDKFLKTGRQQTSLQSSTRARKIAQGTTGHSASLLYVES